VGGRVVFLGHGVQSSDEALAGGGMDDVGTERRLPRGSEVAGGGLGQIQHPAKVGFRCGGVVLACH